MEKITINIEGMSCNHCKMSVESALSALDGVEKAEVILADNLVNVDFDESKVNYDQMKEAIEDKGFDVVE